MKTRLFKKTVIALTIAFALSGCVEDESKVDPTKAENNPSSFDGGLVINGDFSTDTGWIGNAFNVVNGVNSANVATAGNPWDVNLSQVLALETGASYTLSFKARGTENRKLTAGIGLNEAPFTNDSKTLNLTSDWKTYSYTFNTIGFGGANSRVLFDKGDDVGEVYIDDVKLIKVPNPVDEVEALSLTVSATGANTVRMTGPFWEWNPDGGPVASSNGDGTWTVTLDPAPTADMEYLWVVDGVQENLLDNDPKNLSCTPVTDGSGYANRKWTLGSSDITDDVFDSCPAAALTLTVTATGANTVRMTGPFWEWNPDGGPVASSNGDGTWTVTLDPAPAADMEYLWVVDGVQENLLDNDPKNLSCTPVTDGSGYANRKWTLGSSDITDDVFDSCQ